MKKPVLTFDELIPLYIGTFQHFVEEGAYPLRVMSDKDAKNQHYLSKSEANHIIRCMGVTFQRKGDCLALRKGQFPADFLAEYWKFRFNEEREESSRLYNIISGAYRQA